MTKLSKFRLSYCGRIVWTTYQSSVVFPK